jgi:hypothetical protein
MLDRNPVFGVDPDGRFPERFRSVAARLRRISLRRSARPVADRLGVGGRLLRVVRNF